jgi:hypothetical protein
MMPSRAWPLVLLAFPGALSIDYSDPSWTDSCPTFEVTSDLQLAGDPVPVGTIHPFCPFNATAFQPHGWVGWHHGDPNYDGVYNVQDLIIMINAILTPFPTEACDDLCICARRACGDVTWDGVINILDVVTMVGHIVGSGGADPLWIMTPSEMNDPMFNHVDKMMEISLYRRKLANMPRMRSPDGSHVARSHRHLSSTVGAIALSYLWEGDTLWLMYDTTHAIYGFQV